MSQDTENTLKGCLFLIFLVFMGWVWLTDSGSDPESSTKLQPTRTPRQDSSSTLKPTFTPQPTARPTVTATRIEESQEKTAPTPTRTPEPTVSAMVTARGLNVRSGPGVQYGRVGVVGQGAEVLLDGRNQTGTWVHGQISEENLEGWFSVGYMEVTGDTSELPVLETTIASQSQASDTGLPQVTGIGVSREEIQSFFEILGVEFEKMEPVKGQLHVQGWSEDSTLMIQLLGPPENLSSASIMTAISNTQPDMVVESAGYIVFFLNKVVPDWENGLDWIGANLYRSAEETEGVKTTYNDLEIVLQSVMASDGGIITLTVRPIR